MLDSEIHHQQLNKRNIGVGEFQLTRKMIDDDEADSLEEVAMFNQNYEQNFKKKKTKYQENT
jgi:hypothetical protein